VKRKILYSSVDINLISIEALTRQRAGEKGKAAAVGLETENGKRGKPGRLHLDDQAAAAETTASPFSEENREATQASQLQNIKCDRPAGKTKRDSAELIIRL
jgi:hypothetical protein